MRVWNGPRNICANAVGGLAQDTELPFEQICASMLCQRMNIRVMRVMLGEITDKIAAGLLLMRLAAMARAASATQRSPQDLPGSLFRLFFSIVRNGHAFRLGRPLSELVPASMTIPWVRQWRGSSPW